MLEEEEATQTHYLEDLKLHKEFERTSRRQELECERTKNKIGVERLKFEHEVTASRLKNEAELDYLGALKSMSVDLTSFVVAQQGVEVKKDSKR